MRFAAAASEVLASIIYELRILNCQPPTVHPSSSTGGDVLQEEAIAWASTEMAGQLAAEQAGVHCWLLCWFGPMQALATKFCGSTFTLHLALARNSPWRWLSLYAKPTLSYPGNTSGQLPHATARQAKLMQSCQAMCMTTAFLFLFLTHIQLSALSV